MPQKKVVRVKKSVKSRVKKRTAKVVPKKKKRKVVPKAKPKRRVPPKRLVRRVVKVIKKETIRLPKIASFRKHESNPIIEPREDNFWEMKATFNPAAIQAGGRVHILLRA